MDGMKEGSERSEILFHWMSTAIKHTSCFDLDVAHTGPTTPPTLDKGLELKVTPRNGSDVLGSFGRK
jgi:hypothetical protein